MISSKDIFMDVRLGEDSDKAKLKKLPTEAYLTIRKEQMILHEQVKKYNEPDTKHRAR